MALAPLAQQGNAVVEQAAIGHNAHLYHAAHDLSQTVVIEHHAALHAGEYVGVAGAAQADAEHRVPQEIVRRPARNCSRSELLS